MVSAELARHLAQISNDLRRQVGVFVSRDGAIRNVIVGTLLIGVLLNGMTIMDIQYTVQSVIKGIILLTAIVIDTILNPRDEQTAQQGDI